MIYVLQLDGKVPPGIYGSQLLAAGVPHRLLRLDAGDALPPLGNGDSFIVLGGYMGVHEETDYPFLPPLKAYLRQAVKEDIPVLGICLGGQLLADVLGGRVTAGSRGEKGLHSLTLTPEAAADPLFSGLSGEFVAFEWHNDSFDLPPGAVHLAVSAACPGQAFRYRNAWALQFHPEVNRQIVAIWSAAVDPEGHFVNEFATGEAKHRALALRLLENFLAFVRLAKKQRRLAPPRCTRQSPQGNH